MPTFDDISQKLFQINRGLTNGGFEVADFARLVPASLMVHAMDNAGTPQQILYMNEWGCHHLGVELEELNLMKDHYYRKFFVEEDMAEVLPRLLDYCRNNDSTKQYNFFQRVKLYKQKEHKWFYTVCKLLPQDGGQSLIMLSSPVEGVGSMMRKVSRVLEENRYIAANYRKFSLLTHREKEIITQITAGQTTAEISEALFISKETVGTHRKNINRKLEVKSFAELLKFAEAFELVP